MARPRAENPIPFLGDMLRLYNRCGIPRAAAALAYSLILSFFPLLLCVNFLIGLFHLDAQALLASLDQVLPQAALELMGE